jgi:hypothetical protein
MFLNIPIVKSRSAIGLEQVKGSGTVKTAVAQDTVSILQYRRYFLRIDFAEGVSVDASPND